MLQLIHYYYLNMKFYPCLTILFFVCTVNCEYYETVNCLSSYTIQVPSYNKIVITSSDYIDCTPSNTEIMTPNVTQCEYITCEKSYSVSITKSSYNKNCTKPLNSFTIYYTFEDSTSNCTDRIIYVILFFVALGISFSFSCLFCTLACGECYFDTTHSEPTDESEPLLNNSSESDDSGSEYDEILFQIKNV